MSLKQMSSLKILLTTIECCIAGYLAFMVFGGFLVFGFRSFAEFCLIVVPLFILPAALLGYRYPVASAAGAAVVTILFFGIQVYELGPPLTRILHNDMQFFKFLSVTVLLTIAASLDHVLQSDGTTTSAARKPAN